MKLDHKKHIDLELVVQQFIETLNKFAEDKDLKKVYSLDIKDNHVDGIVSVNKAKKKASAKKKTLSFVVASLENNERLTLLSIDYRFNNPAEILSSKYKLALYKEFLSSILTGFAINFENIIRASMAEELLANNLKNNVQEDIEKASSYLKTDG